MKKSKQLFNEYKIILFFTLAILVYLGIKTLFWPRHQPIITNIYQQKNQIFNLDTPRQIIKQQQYFFDKIYFPQGNELFHENVGHMYYKENFFINLNTLMKVSASANFLFRIRSDDGFRLKIDNKLICESISEKAISTIDCRTKLSKGDHVIALSYFQGYGSLGLTLWYQAEAGKQYIVGENSAITSFKRLQ